MQLGGTFTWQKGEHDPDRDGAFTPMPGFRISPVKVTAYAQHQTSTKWRNRLQATYGGQRDEFPGSTNFGEGRVGEVFLVDLFSSVDLPKGTLRLGVSNLLDRFYIPQANQAFNFDGLYIAGRGRTVTASYVLPW